MRSASFEKLPDGSLLVTLSEVVDHADQGPVLRKFCESLQHATCMLGTPMMVNDGELSFQLKIVPKEIFVAFDKPPEKEQKKRSSKRK